MDSTEASDGKRKALIPCAIAENVLPLSRDVVHVIKKGGSTPTIVTERDSPGGITWREEIEIVTIVICLNNLTTKSISIMPNVSWLGSSTCNVICMERCLTMPA